tara:strand:+ start:4403 stop:5194 length:792 start_codon:yes stop_codon:yes gene_type:complete
MSNKGDRFVDLAEVARVAVPRPTDTYCPVAHEAFITLVMEKADENLGLGVPQRQEFGLAQNGQQLFFCLTWDSKKYSDYGFSIAGRNSYNMTLSAGMAGGGNVGACSNLMLWGDKFKVLRKHTANVWADLPILIGETLRSAVAVEDDMQAHFAAMRQVEMTEVQGHAMLGMALGAKVLRPQQATVAFKAWDEDWHDAGRSHYGLLQAMTEGTKKGSAGRAVRAHTGVYGYMLDATSEHARVHPQTIDAEVVAALTRTLPALAA